MTIINKNKIYTIELYNTKPFFEDETIDGKYIYNLSLIIKKDTTDHSVFIFKYYNTFIDAETREKETNSDEEKEFLSLDNKKDKEYKLAEINKIIKELAEDADGIYTPQYEEKIELLKEYKRIYL